MSATKLDLRKLHHDCYYASEKDFQIVCVPRIQFLMVDGCGDPCKEPRFDQCIDALYAVASALKAMLRQDERWEDYVMPPLEGLWWSDDPHDFSLEIKDQWRWTLMIAQPDFVNQQHVQAAIAQAGQNKNLPAVGHVRLESYEEGLACQTLHIGPCDEHLTLIQRMHVFVHQKGHHLRGKHHEIYMNDRRRQPPEKHRIIVRHAIM